MLTICFAIAMRISKTKCDAVLYYLPLCGDMIFILPAIAAFMTLFGVD